MNPLNTAPVATLTPADLDVIEARASAATPGPWRRAPSLGIDSEVCAGRHEAPTLSAEIHAFPDGGDPRADADFIAASREDVPQLVAALRAQAGKIDRLRALAREGWEHAREVADGEGIEPSVRVAEALSEIDVEPARCGATAPGRPRVTCAEAVDHPSDWHASATLSWPR